MYLFVLIFSLVSFLFVWLLWLAYICIFPGQWAWFIDQEQKFLVKHGIVSESVSNQLKRMEKGIVVKAILSATIIFGMMSISIIVLRYIFGFQI
jgi:hypothetical protein